MSDPDETDPREAEVIHPEDVVGAVRPSTTGTVVPTDDDEPSDDGRQAPPATPNMT